MLTLPEPSVLGDDTTVLWPCRAYDFVALWRYRSPFDAQPVIVDIWEGRDGDSVVVTNRMSDVPPWARDTAESGEIWPVVPGDRLVHLRRHSDGRYQVCGFLEVEERAKAIGVANEHELSPEGWPVPFGALSNDTPPPELGDVHRSLVRLGLPRSWAPLD